MSNEAKDLKQRILDTDFSVESHPGIQRLIETELERWVKSYTTKKTRGFWDCYGNPGEIPDQIELNGASYSPPEILEHVKTRDEIGMDVLKRVNTYRVENFIVGDPINVYLELIPDDANLDEVMSRCQCGHHNLTYRNVLAGLIEVNPEITGMKSGLPDAIKSLYSTPEKLIIPRQTFLSKLGFYVSKLFSL